MSYEVDARRWGRLMLVLSMGGSFGATANLMFGNMGMALTLFAFAFAGCGLTLLLRVLIDGIDSAAVAQAVGSASTPGRRTSRP